MCLFCKIVNNEIMAKSILENDDFLAFEDIYPKAPVHILIIPKKHIVSFDEVDAQTMAKMTPFIQEVAKVAKLTNGYRLITNIGEDGTQEIKHLHFHLLGGERLGVNRFGK